MMRYKLAAAPFEYPALLEQWPELGPEQVLGQYLSERDLTIPVWNAADVSADYSRVGLAGSPTKVLKVDYVVLEAAGIREFQASPEGIVELLQELVSDYIL
jgi:electron transfer flavoprotein beta subunit